MKNKKNDSQNYFTCMKKQKLNVKHFEKKLQAGNNGMIQTQKYSTALKNS